MTDLDPTLQALALRDVEVAQLRRALGEALNMACGYRSDVYGSREDFDARIAELRKLVQP